MRKLVRNQSKKRGLPPGTPVFVGEERAHPVRISIFEYNADSISHHDNARVEQCLPLKTTSGVTWIDLDGVHETQLVGALADGFGLHPLVQEDILHTSQRPKLEDYGDYLYIVLKMLRWDDARHEIIAEQVSMILTANVVISFQEQPGDLFDPIRVRIRSGKGRIRKMRADYLAYSLLDAIVDGHYAVLEQLGEEIETAEAEVVATPNPKVLRRLHRLKRENLLLRRSVWPLRDVLGGLERSDSPLIAETTRLYLRDAYGHAVQVIDIMETFRDMLTGMVDTYLSSISNRMNEVMKVLTIIATIFIPLTFIAGVYGMNFSYMPETQWWWGYFAALAVMAVVAGIMLVYFKRKRWL